MIFTVSKQSTAKIKIKGSEFIGLITPTQTTNDFDSFLKTIRKEHFKATHHCQAYRLGPDPIVEFQSDDGEPRGSAGSPMLNTLKSSNIVNVGVIVVRYYGGTKLGVRGLIDAYSEATKAAIDAAEQVVLSDQCIFQITYPYSLQSEINTLLHGVETHHIDSIFEEKIAQKLSVESKKIETVTQLFQKNEHLGIAFEILNRSFLPKP